MSDATEHDAWFRRETQTGLDAANAGDVVLAEEVEAEAVAWRAETRRKMAEKLSTYDPAEDLNSDEAIAVFMGEAFQTNDAGYIAHALGVVARAKD